VITSQFASAVAIVMMMMMMMCRERMKRTITCCANQLIATAVFATVNVRSVRHLPPMGGARRWQGGGAAAPVPSYLPRLPPPTCQNNDFRCHTGVFYFFVKSN